MIFTMFQLILNPIRDWNTLEAFLSGNQLGFQLILNPIRDWNFSNSRTRPTQDSSN